MSIAYIVMVGLIRPSHSASTSVNTYTTGKEHRDSLRGGVRRHQIKSTSTGLPTLPTDLVLSSRTTFHQFFFSLPYPLCCGSSPTFF